MSSRDYLSRQCFALACFTRARNRPIGEAALSGLGGRKKARTVSRPEELVANGHGAGFPDSYDFPGREGQRLRRLAKSFGECPLYEGDDRRQYFY